MSREKRRLIQVDVELNGQQIAKRPLSFRLVTDQWIPTAVCELIYPATVDIGGDGDDIVIALKTPDSSHVLFTGHVYNVKVYGNERRLNLTDGYKNLFDTVVTPAYRKETAAVILSDTLDAAGITDQAITCPDVEIPRFSLPQTRAPQVLSYLIKTLRSFGFSGLRYFFDAENTFRFGTASDSAINPGEPLSLETGRNIIAKYPEKIITLPVAFRHSQEIEVDGVAVTATRTELVLTARRSSLAIRVKEKE